ncbi:unnamed protein product, partial [Heterosigma akashiwo]
PVPVASRCGLLPPSPRAAQGSKAPKPSYQSRRRAQVGRFWSCKGFWNSSEKLHPRGGDPLVPGAGRAAGVAEVLHPRGRLEHRLHLRRDVERAAAVHGHLRAGPAGPHLPAAGHAHRPGLPRPRRAARVEGRPPAPGDAGAPGAQPRGAGRGPAPENAMLRPWSKNIGAGCYGPPFL